MSEHYVLKVQSSLTLAQADRMVEGALAAARAADLLPRAVAVLDSGGQLVALKREDGCGVLRFDIAFGKAWGALGMGISSRTIRDRLGNRPVFQAALAAASGGRFVPVPGGVLALGAGRTVVGAIGISGDASDRDEYAAIKGVQAARLASLPEAPAENWQSAGL